MREKELDGWFCSLPIVRKNHIAAKVVMKEWAEKHEGANAPADVVKAKMYPNCTGVWMGLDVNVKARVHDHCTNDHGDWIQEGGDAPIFSY